MKNENPLNKDIIEETVTSFENRKKVKIHNCLGCDPCLPAEWTVELLRKCKSEEKC